MISYILIENGLVKRVDCNYFEGSIEFNGDVCCGQLYDSLTMMVNSPVKSEKTTLEKIQDLENSITERNRQEAILGDEYAIAVIQSVRDQIEVLRDQL